MKKGLAIIGIACAAIAAYFIFTDKKKSFEDALPVLQHTVSASKNSDAFNTPFTKVLNSYFSLHEALVNWDSAKANLAADSLRMQLAKVPYNELAVADSIKEKAKNLSESTAAEVDGFIAENTLDDKRKSFYTLSEYLYSLIKTVHYDKQVIYHDKCPMAFNESEAAFWISNSAEIINPYFGNKHPHYKSGMMHCGNIEDSVDYRQ